ncbi:hypothetical protein ACN47E_003962 [Coniothyrium glycines]
MCAVIARYASKLAYGNMDILLELNMVLLVVLDVVLFVVVHLMAIQGIGQDIWTVQPKNITKFLMYFWLCVILYFAIMAFIRTAFILFFLQIFPGKRFRIVAWCVLAINLVVMIVTCIPMIFVCTPVSFLWKGWTAEPNMKGTCINQNSLAYAAAALGIVIDLMTLALPITQIWNLTMDIRKKVGVMLMFSVGAIVPIVSIIRLRSIVRFATTPNVTWDYREAGLWSIVEFQVGIICVCLPAIRLGLSRWIPNVVDKTMKTSTPTRDSERILGDDEGHHTFVQSRGGSHIKDHRGIVELVDFNTKNLR